MAKTLELLPAPRIPLKLPVEFRRTYGRKSVAGSLRNVSLTGAFLECPLDTLQTRDRLEIYLEVAGRKRELQAEVVWSNSRGCGIRFLVGSSRDTQIVDDLMEVVKETRATKRELLNDIFKNVA